MTWNSINEDKILLALDLDGTLLTEEKKLLGNTKNHLEKAISEGIHISIVTGRSFESVKQVALEYNLDLPIVCSNGALIKDPFSLKEFFKVTIDYKEASFITEFSNQIDCLLHIFTDNGWYVNQINEEVKKHENQNKHKAKLTNEIEDWKALNIIKMVLVAEAEEINKLENWIKANKFDINLFRSDPYSVDIINHNASKGKAVEKLANHFGVKRAGIVAVGNYFNDLEMFRVAGFSVAMDNAPEQVKRAADHVTSSNEEEGVVEVIKHILS